MSKPSTDVTIVKLSELSNNEKGVIAGINAPAIICIYLFKLYFFDKIYFFYHTNLFDLLTYHEGNLPFLNFLCIY
ncbi:hypothetical protein CoNPh20_CDS0033 [Staphylococcus phage S-CoN_Ph20]|nr:hypothetical protein CoNPh18_CDS0041 [Staphylococcus phage S-CoN_Ph18]WNM54659.1 hypothetical protein CoNPh20_CDS0033 [Staphylococcus phage S-CoN_Ph20]